MATLTHAELEALWESVGGSPPSADIAAAIAQAESSGCQYALAGPVDIRPVQECTYRHTTTENSCGFWQINLYAHPDYSAPSIFDQQENARAAVAISQNGLSFEAWSTYKDGSYVQFLANPQQPGGGGTVEPLSGGASAVNLPSDTMTRAWSRLMHTLAVDAPRQLREAKTARARIRKAVR